MQPTLNTPLCERLGIRYPIIQAPMAGGWTTPALVAAVSNAGGLGNLAAARTTVEELEQAIREVRASSQRNFGVNLLLAPPEPAPVDVAAVQEVLDGIRADLGLPPGARELRLPPSIFDEQFELIVRARVPIISFAMGNPGPLIDRAHQADATVLVTVTCVEEALAAEGAGADVVIAQGIEAGGHRGMFRSRDERDLPQVGTLALVPQVVDAVKIPVIAAGGIMDGRGVVAALALGAQAVQLGTRFLLARESGAYPAYRSRLREGVETATSITRLLTGRPARVLRNRILERLEASGVEPLPWPYQGMAAADIYSAAVERGDADTMALMAGQRLRMSRDEVPAAVIVEMLVQEASAILSAFAASAQAGSLEPGQRVVHDLG